MHSSPGPGAPQTQRATLNSSVLFTAIIKILYCSHTGWTLDTLLVQLVISLVIPNAGTLNLLGWNFLIPLDGNRKVFAKL